MTDLDKYKFELSQKYGISESSIDESIVPILLALDENTKANKDFSDKIKGSIQSIHYNDPKTAFWGNLAKYGIPSLIVGISISVIGLIWYTLNNKENNEVVNPLNTIIEIRGEDIFIDKKHYRVGKDGIYIRKEKP